jgi:hypothetical protein
MPWVISPEEIEKRRAELQGQLEEAEGKVANIRARLSRLDSLKSGLTEEFGDGSQLPMEFPPPPPRPAPSHILSGRKPTSTERVIQYLLEHGPRKRTVISQETGIPMGTLHFAMSDHTKFRSVFGKRWDLTQAVRDAAKKPVAPKPLL